MAANFDPQTEWQIEMFRKRLKARSDLYRRVAFTLAAERLMHEEIDFSDPARPYPHRLSMHPLVRLGAWAVSRFFTHLFPRKVSRHSQEQPEIIVIEPEKIKVSFPKPNKEDTDVA